MTAKPYSWTTDVCIQGYERLRTQSEFMLVVPVSASSTVKSIRESLEADLQSCDHGESMDYDRASATIDEVCAMIRDRFKARLAKNGRNPFNLERLPRNLTWQQRDNLESCYLFVYLDTDTDDCE